MQELSTLQLIETFKRFITACQLSIQMPLSFNQKWVILSHYLNIYPLHSHKLVEYSNKCADIDLEKQFVEDNLLKFTLPQTTQKNNFHSDKTTLMTQASFYQKNLEEIPSDSIDQFGKKENLSPIKPEYASISSISQNENKDKLVKIATDKDCNLISSSVRNQRLKTDEVEKIKIDKVRSSMLDGVKQSLAKMRNNTKIVKETFQRTERRQLDVNESCMSVFVNETIKKVDANTLRQRIIVLKEKEKEYLTNQHHQSNNKIQKSQQQQHILQQMTNPVQYKMPNVVSNLQAQYLIQNQVQKNMVSQRKFN